MIPSQDGVVQLHRRPHDSDFIEARVPFGADDQRLAIGMALARLSVVDENSVDVVIVDGLEFEAHRVVLLDQLSSPLDEDRAQEALDDLQRPWVDHPNAERVNGDVGGDFARQC